MTLTEFDAKAEALRQSLDQSEALVREACRPEEQEALARWRAELEEGIRKRRAQLAAMTEVDSEQKAD